VISKRTFHISFLTLAILVTFGFSLYVTHAQTADELQGKINQTNDTITQLNAEIAQYQSQLTELGKTKSTLASTISELSITSKKLNVDIKVTQQKIQAALLLKQKLAQSIQVTGTTISTHESAIAHLLKNTNETDKTDLVNILMQPGATLGTFWNQIVTNQAVQSQLLTEATQLHKDKTDLENHKQAVEANQKELETLALQLKDQKKVNDKIISQKNTLLAETKNNEANYAKLLKDRQAKEAALETDVRNYETQLKFVLNPGSIPSAGTAVFSWPADKIYITQLFGKTGASGRLYASGTHNGVDFGMPVGTPVKVVLGGTIMGSGNTDLTCPGASYGNWVLVKHDNGLATVYGHLSLVTAQTGTRVNTGDIIAYSGSTGYATGPHLHVSAFVSVGVKIQTLASKACSGKVYTMPIAPIGAYLDPMQYFPIPTKAMLQYAS
jgi:murein DD-endopeptidase MepM/ murein hydrolase activator NlpD